MLAAERLAVNRKGLTIHFFRFIEPAMVAHDKRKIVQVYCNTRMLISEGLTIYRERFALEAFSFVQLSFDPQDVG